MQVVSVREDNMPSEEEIHEFLSTHFEDFMFNYLEPEPKKSEFQMIEGFLTTTQVDFLVVGSKGLQEGKKKRNDYLGAVSNSCLKMKKINCLFVV